MVPTELKSTPTQHQSNAVYMDSQTPTSSGGGKATTRTMEKVISDIETEQRKITKKEGDIILYMVRIGVLLTELQSAAGRTWTKQVQKLGYHQRTASRLQMIGSNWHHEIGTLGSAIMQHLPNDAQKLEWLCRLRRDQLGELLSKIDCKKASRGEVAAAVKDALGEKTTTQASRSNTTKVIDRLLARIVAAIGDWQQTDYDLETSDQLSRVIVRGIEQLQQALGTLQGRSMREAINNLSIDSDGQNIHQEATPC